MIGDVIARRSERSACALKGYSDIVPERVSRRPTWQSHVYKLLEIATLSTFARNDINDYELFHCHPRL